MSSSQSDNIMGMIGGFIGASLSVINSGEMVKVALFGFIGGIVGYIGKKIGETIWNAIYRKLKR